LVAVDVGQVEQNEVMTNIYADVNIKGCVWLRSCGVDAGRKPADNPDAAVVTRVLPWRKGRGINNVVEIDAMGYRRKAT
jgi:hypothetical protein